MAVSLKEASAVTVVFRSAYPPWLTSIRGLAGSTVVQLPRVQSAVLSGVATSTGAGATADVTRALMRLELRVAGTVLVLGPVLEAVLRVRVATLN